MSKQTLKETIQDRLAQFAQSLVGSERGWKSQFAERLGVSPQVANDYLSGRVLPGNSMQAKLRELGCDIEWLMSGDVRDGPALSARDRELLDAMSALGIRSSDQLKRLVDENDKLRRALGPEVIAAVSEAAIVMEKQAKNKIRKRKR